MEHTLDNPIWNALSTGNRMLAYGDDNVKILRRDVGAFIGLKNNSGEDLRSLYEMISAATPVVLFASTEIFIPENWQTLVKKPLLQLAYSSQNPPRDKVGAADLSEENIDEMLSLTSLAKPGPFLERTIDFGNYQGIFYNERLIAMAGQRLQPTPYIEISAVCTHPDYLGRGLAKALVTNQVHTILDQSCIPFLHVEPGNKPAYYLYKNLGFTLRKELLCYVLQKPEL